MPRYTPIAWLVLLLVACSGEQPKLSPGIIELCVENGQPRQYLKSSSTTVPINLPPWQSFGFWLQLPDDTPHQVTTTHYLPAAPKQLGESWREQGYSPADAVGGMTTAPVEVVRGRWFSFGTDPDDPIGTYKISISIDGEIVESLNFEVVPGGNPDAVRGDPAECPQLQDISGRLPPNKALQLTANSAFQLRFGSLLA